MDRWITLFTREAGSRSAKENPKLVQIQISKKIVPTAVQRNRIRRLIKEVLRLDWSLDKNLRYTFRVSKNPKNPDYRMVQNALQSYRKSS